MARTLVRNKHSGEYIVIDEDLRRCSDTLHYTEIHEPLEDYHLDDDLEDDYDPADWITN